ncbi:MAG: RCC1 repeat-containing protein, partial [Candidatus Wolfebacteria bacterium GW2011_GWC2_46_275]
DLCLRRRMEKKKGGGGGCYGNNEIREAHVIRRKVKAIKIYFKTVQTIVNNNRIRSGLGRVTVIAFMLSIIMAQANITKGATYTFVQTDWSGGASAEMAAHLTDRAGWNRYNTASSSITISTVGEITLAQTSTSSTQTSEVDFAAGTLASTTIVGAGMTANVQLSSNYISIAGGGYHSVALKSDGTVWAWGRNNYGELGEGSGISKSTPVQVSGLSDVIAVSAGGDHALALKSDGTVWAWGYNANGQLGDGTTINKTTPIQIAGLSGVRTVLAGSLHSLVLKDDGTVWAWGENGQGQLGDGTTTDKTTPVQVVGLTGVESIGGGNDSSHSFALKDDGTVWAWGDNYSGQLGDGTTTDKTTPVQVVGLTGVESIGGGFYFSVALKNDGTIWTWGANTYGQLGNGSTTGSRSIPAQVVGLADVSAISAGFGHTIALKNDGTIWTWGYNTSGQIGDGTIVNRLTPAQIAGLTGVGIIGTGNNHSLVVKTDGSVWTWGKNDIGQLGDNTATNRLTPTQVWSSVPSGYFSGGKIPTSATTTTIAAGDNFSLALKTDGTAWAWGHNYYKQLGDGSTIQKSAPSQALTSGEISSVDGGQYHTIFLKTDGTVWASGANNYGQLGDGTTSGKATPVQVSGLVGVSAISGGSNHTISAKADGTVWVWGYNNYGQLGNGTTTDSLIPIQVPGLTGISGVAGGESHSLALKTDGTVWAWGYNTNGQLGNGTTTNSLIPIQVSNLTGVNAIAAGRFFSLALKTDGTVWAWGANSSGQLGDGTTVNKLIPTQVLGVSGASAIAAGFSHSLVLKTDGTVWASGFNNYGQLGDGTTVNKSMPIQIPSLTGVSAVATGAYHSLALKNDGTVQSWGYNAVEQLGDTTVTSRSTPGVVKGWITAMDNISVGTIYRTVGLLTSQVIDTGQKSAYGTMTFTSTIPADAGMSVDIHSGNSATPDGSWTEWQTNIISGDAIASQNGNRYVQYRVNFTSNGVVTAQLSDVTINYSSYPTLQTLTSSIYDTGVAENLLNKIMWSASTTVVSTITFQLRTSANGETWTDWYGVDGVGSYFTASDGTQTMPALFSDGLGDRYIQYRVFITSDGSATPVLIDTAITYVVNAPPEFDSVASTTATQVSDSANENWGKVVVNYSVRDSDADTGTAQPGYVTPIFEYNIGSGWQPISSSTLATGDKENKEVQTSLYTAYSATWDAKVEIPEQYSATAQIRVSVSDREAANATTTVTTANFVLDTKKPTFATVASDGANGILAYAASDDTNIAYRLSNNADLSPDNTNATAGIWVDAGATSVSASTTWIFTGDPLAQLAYCNVHDLYGNTATNTIVLPARPENFDLKDVSNNVTQEFREFLSWKTYTATTSANFSRYEVWRNADGGAYSLYHTIGAAQGGPDLNYYMDAVVASSTMYGYKIRVIDTDGDGSLWAITPSDQPDGQGGTDVTSPDISAVTTAERQSNWAKITFTTDEPTFASVTYKKVDGSGETIASSTSLGTSHIVALPNLDQNTVYSYKIFAVDIYGNGATVDNGGEWYTFTTRRGTRISDVTATIVDDKNAVIVWNTDTDANSAVTYATNVASLNNATNTITVQSASLVGGPPYQHSVTLTDLAARTTYWYSVSSTDEAGDVATDKNNLAYYSFTTSYDQKPPVISDVSVPVTAQNSIVAYWKTNELADARLSIGTASSTYLTTTSDLVMSMTHAVVASGLAANTTYHYQARSCDPAGNCANSEDKTVTTAKEGEVTIVTVGGGSGAGRFTEPPTPKDTTPPTITNIKIATTTAFGTTISFNTSEATLGMIRYGKEANVYGITTTGSQADWRIAQTVTLGGLRPGTDYHFRIKAIDKGGNETISEDMIFRTQFLSEMSPESKTIENIQAYEAQLQDTIESILPSIVPPFVELPQVYDVTEEGATISWRTNIKAYGGVGYSSEEVFAQAATTTSEIKYEKELSDTENKTREHELRLNGLKPNTLYHFRVKAYSFPEAAGLSKDSTFITKAPKISASVVDVRNTSFRAVWTTEEPVTTIVEYKDMKRGGISRKIDETMKPYHELLIEGLLPATQYEVKVFGYNTRGNLVESGDSIMITTSKDIIAPKINNFKVDGALVPGRTDRIQTIVSWVTDEPSNSTVYYQEGPAIVKGDFSNKSSDLTTFTQTHTVILPNLKPGTVYQMKVESIDQAGNDAYLGPRTIITPQKGESIFDVIFKNFEETFKFLRTAGQ